MSRARPTPASALVAAVGIVTLIAMIAILSGCDGELRFDDGLVDSSPRDAVADVRVEESDAVPSETEIGADVSSDAPTPGRCVTDVDCKATSSHCDVVLHLCVPCVSDAQCTTSPAKICDATTHQCVECRTESDCGDPTKVVCDGASHSCVRVCDAAGKCPADAPICDARSYCVGCANDTQCIGVAGRAVCQPSSGRCVQCIADGGCPVGRPRCSAAFQCVQCVTSADCPAVRPSCDFAKGDCVR